MCYFKVALFKISSVSHLCIASGCTERYRYHNLAVSYIVLADQKPTLSPAHRLQTSSVSTCPLAVYSLNISLEKSPIHHTRWRGKQGHGEVYSNKPFSSLRSISLRLKNYPSTQWTPSERAIKIAWPPLFHQTPVGGGTFIASMTVRASTSCDRSLHRQRAIHFTSNRMEQEGQTECFPFHECALLTYLAADVWEGTGVTPSFFFIYSSVHCELCTHIWNHFAASKRENSRLVSQPVVVQANGSTSSAQTVGSGGYRCSNPSSTKSISCCRGFEPWLDFQNAQKKIKAILYLIKLFAKLTGQNIKWIFYTIYTHDYN